MLCFSYCSNPHCIEPQVWLPARPAWHPALTLRDPPPHTGCRWAPGGAVVCPGELSWLLGWGYPPGTGLLHLVFDDLAPGLAVPLLRLLHSHSSFKTMQRSFFRACELSPPGVPFLCMPIKPECKYFIIAAVCLPDPSEIYWRAASMFYLPFYTQSQANS